MYTLRLVGGVHTTLPYTTPPGKKLAVYVCIDCFSRTSIIFGTENRDRNLFRPSCVLLSTDLAKGEVRQLFVFFTISNSIYFASIVPRLPSIRVGCARAPCQYNQFARSMHFSNKRVASLIVGMSLPVCAAWCWWGYSLHNQVCNLPTLFM